MSAGGSSSSVSASSAVGCHNTSSNRAASLLPLTGCPTHSKKTAPVLYTRYIKRMEAFRMKCQRQIANIRRQDHMWNRRFLSDRSWSCAGSNLPSSQLTVWACSQTFRGHTCPPSLAVSHRSVTRSPSRPEFEAMSRPPLEQVALPTLKGLQYTSC